MVLCYWQCAVAKNSFVLCRVPLEGAQNWMAKAGLPLLVGGKQISPFLNESCNCRFFHSCAHIPMGSRRTRLNGLWYWWHLPAAHVGEHLSNLGSPHRPQSSSAEPCVNVSPVAPSQGPHHHCQASHRRPQCCTPAPSRLFGELCSFPIASETMNFQPDHPHYQTVSAGGGLRPPTHRLVNKWLSPDPHYCWGSDH